MTGQDIHPGSAVQEVEDHLRGHLFGKCRDPLLDNTVVPGKGVDDLFRKVGLQIAADGGNPAAELFDPAERAERFCLVVELCLRRFQQGLINRFYPCKGSFQNFHFDLPI